MTDEQQARYDAWRTARETLKHQVVLARHSKFEHMALLELSVQPGDVIVAVLSPYSPQPEVAEAA